jgi:uncharacterized phage protein gp47/JayE
VTINGITRRSPSRSTVDLLLSGTVGTEISEGVVADLLGTKWRIPGVVVIPSGGEVTVTAEAEIEGAVEAASGTVTSILTPTLGWQAATNPTAASAGAPVESDAQLRSRQILSTGLPSRTVMDGILAAVAAVPNVTRYVGLENDTSSTDSNGIPSHSIALVVEGGDATAIAEVMALKKGPGCGTFGSTTEVVVDSFGVPRDISFSRPTILTILVEISLVALSGYTASVGNAIRLAVADYISGLEIGEDLYLSRIYVPASLFGEAGSETYNITDILIAVDPGTPAASNIVVDFDEAVFCATTNVTLAVS